MSKKLKEKYEVITPKRKYNKEIEIIKESKVEILKSIVLRYKTH